MKYHKNPFCIYVRMYVIYSTINTQFVCLLTISWTCKRMCSEYVSIFMCVTVSWVPVDNQCTQCECLGEREKEMLKYWYFIIILFNKCQLYLHFMLLSLSQLNLKLPLTHTQTHSNRYLKRIGASSLLTLKFSNTLYTHWLQWWCWLTTCQHTYGAYVCSWCCCAYDEWMYVQYNSSSATVVFFVSMLSCASLSFVSSRLVVFQINILCFISCVLPRVVVPRVTSYLLFWCFGVNDVCFHRALLYEWNWKYFDIRLL